MAAKIEEVRGRDVGPGKSPPLVNTVRIRENGPLAVHAPHSIAGQPSALRATLCRCGASQRKPYCDGSHSAAAFQATGTGRTIDRVTEAWLCRCGASANKPYCDGSHRKVGFKS